MKNELISEIEIFLAINYTDNYPLKDLDVYDDENEQGESHKTISITKYESGLCVDLDNGDSIPLSELSEKELKNICDELDIIY